MSSRTFAEFLDDIEQDRDIAEQQREMKPSRDLAMMLVGVRKRLCLTQGALARQAHVSQSYVAQLESGAANPSIRSIDRLLRRAGVSWRMEAAVAATPGFGRVAEASVIEAGEQEELTQGEMDQLLRVMDGAVRALRRARLDAHPVTREEMLGEIVAAYDTGPRLIHGNGKPAGQHRA